MANKKINDGITAEVTPKTNLTVEPKVRIFIPLADESLSDTAIDQTETVIINGRATRIRRGEYVDVKVPVFLQLKQRYPNI